MMNVKRIVYENNYEGSFVIEVNNNNSNVLFNDNLRLVDNKTIFSYLNSLFSIIALWNREYIEYDVIDGNSWSLLIYYIDGSSTRYYGRNNYPSNYEAFKMLNDEFIGGK